MNLNLKIVLATSTLLGTAVGLTSFADAAPTGLTQGAPAVQNAIVTGNDTPQIENVWWHRYHRWHRWHRWHRY
jgi:hypothetical protein